MERSPFGRGIKCALPICLGIIPVGISYGLLAIQAGLSQAEAVMMSVFVMAGSSQLMAIGMIGETSVVSIVTAVFFVNLRHIVMSCSVMNRLEKVPLGKRLLCAFALCDESFALFSLSDERSAEYLLGTNTLLYATWVLSSFAGCMMGQILPEVISKSFGVAFYAAFLAMLVPNTFENKGILRLVLLTAMVNTALRFLIPTSWSIIISMLVGAVVGACFLEGAEK